MGNGTIGALEGVSPLNQTVQDLLHRAQKAMEREYTELDDWFMAADAQVINQRVGPAWRRLAERVEGLPVPAVDDDGPSLVWSQPGIYLEIEFTEGGSMGWTAKDRVTGERGDGTAKNTSDEALVSWLHRVRRV